MKILLLGKNGQVGWELQRSLSPLGKVLALDSKSLDYCGDLSDLVGLSTTIRRFMPDVIVNAAAYTAVDNAETEYPLAYRINAEGVSVLAQEAQRLGALLVHYSTDYVFSGEGKEPWQETDPVAPLNRYGESKLAGENAIQKSGCMYLILRTSWVYSTHGHNFVKTILRLLKENNGIDIIDDQFGVPTSAELLADVTAHAIRDTLRHPELSGLYHLAPSGETTWFRYAHFILEYARSLDANLNISAYDIRAISTTMYITSVKRPKNSRLDTNKFRNSFTLELPTWQTGVTRVLNEIIKR